MLQLRFSLCIKEVIAITYYKARSDRQLTRYVSFGQDRELAGPPAVT